MWQFYNLPYDQTSIDLSVDSDWVYTTDVSPKINKYSIYTPMGGSQTINVMVYALFGVPHKLKV